MPRRTPTEPGCVHHIAFNVSRAVFMQAVKRLDAREIKHTGVRDRQIFDAIYFEDPLGLLIELSCYKFEPPHGFTHADVLFEAHLLRVARGDRAIPARRTWLMRSRCWSRGRKRVCRPIEVRRTPIDVDLQVVIASEAKQSRLSRFVGDPWSGSLSLRSR